jgi:hypothetical protein
VEWVHDRYVDHAVYGLLRSDYNTSEPQLGGIERENSGTLESVAEA